MNNPNVLLLTLDTLRADRLGCYGRRPSLTLAIDRLAESGLLFTQAITAGSWTQAAFPAILTSTYPSMYGGCLGYLSAQRPSPVETLARNGYATAGFSTMPHLSKTTGYDRGFEHFVDLEPSETDPLLRKVRGGARLLRSKAFHSLLSPLGVNMRPARVYCSAEEVVAALGTWMEGTRKPFFAWAHFMDTHWPYHLEASLKEPTEVALAWQDLSVMHERADRSKPSALSNQQRERFIRLYEQALAYLDSQIGQLIGELEDHGLLENTIVILLSDHGEEFSDHGYWGHTERNMYDEILHVPLIMRLPGVKDGRVIQRQVRLLDLMPTVLDLCDCPAPDGMEGTSLVPLWSGNKADYEVEVSISERPRHPWYRIAVRTESYKYIWEEGETYPPELYDLKVDPDETSNIYQEKPQVAAQFQAIVDRHLERVAQSQPDTPLPPLHHDQKVLARLRDLGYVD